MILLQVYSLQHGDKVSTALPSAVLGPGQDVTAGQGNGDALLLGGPQTHGLAVRESGYQSKGCRFDSQIGRAHV